MTEQKTVFISYRRSTSRHLARLIYQDLHANGWDVFFDVNTIDSGDFDRIILNQIAAKAHFILLISQDALARCVNEGDWVLQEIREAVRLDRNIVPIVEEGASLEKEISYLPSDLRAVIGKKNRVKLDHEYFEAAMDKLRTRFLKSPAYIGISTPPAAELTEIKRRIEDIDFHTINLIDIPAGDIKLTKGGYLKSDQTFQVPAFAIAKYPVTNAQYAKFIAARGYYEPRWWTNTGWREREQKTWTHPLYWTDPKFNGLDQPVIGVSWHEAVAFCLWLSDVTGENIVLPKDQQWQRAAQGNDNRIYPWGDQWDAHCCNNNVDRNIVGGTTSVNYYEGKGNSFFGVVDMSGNVKEWCLTAYETGNNSVDGSAFRVVRGGSWFRSDVDEFRCDYRDWFKPNLRSDSDGFRIVVSQ
jgi:formylglycine-generating enzyme required for sulfatase activity